jgi:hypoxanthine phosphoribosyltransferase
MKINNPSIQSRRTKVKDLIFEPYLTAEAIQMKVRELAERIEEDYRGKNPVFLSVLNGAFRFSADLARYLDLHSEWEFIKLSSYQGTKSTGQVRIASELPKNLEGRHVIIVEDIIDTGTTMHFFIEKLLTLQPASVKLASFLLKEEALKHPVTIDYLCFSIPNKFVLGYGLDYDGLGRNYNNLWQLSE